MIEILREYRNRARKLGDDLAREMRERGLRGSASLARWMLDAPDEGDAWNDWEYRTFDALLDRMCAYGAGFPRPADTLALESSLEFIETFPEGRRSQLRDLLAIFEAGSLLLGPDGQYRRFTELDDEAADTYLASWDESALPPRRAAFNALKSVCMVGYWSQPDSWAPIGYSLEENPGLDTS